MARSDASQNDRQERTVDQPSILVTLGHGLLGEMASAAAPGAVGDTVMVLSSTIVPFRNKYTIQIDRDRHLLCSDERWQAVNHACEPNLRADVVRRELIAIRPIQVGEALSFHYNTTEWSLIAPFTCRCGSPTCLGAIGGFRHMTGKQRKKIERDLSPFIASRMDRFD